MGQSVSLAWDRNSSHTNLAAYVVKYGTTSGSYTGQVTLATNVTTAVINNLPLGRTYYFVVTARAATGTESDPSNEVITNTPPNTSNRAPVVSSGSSSTLEDQAVSLSLNATDADADPLTYIIVTSPANGSLSGTAPNLTYTPAANFSGTDSFTFRVNDGSTNSGLATISITVTAVNDAPTLNSLANLTVATNSGARTVNLSGISSGAANESQALTITATSSNPGVIPNPSVSYTSGNTTGSLTFTPQANASGTAIITVTVNDGQAQNNTVTRTFTVVVNPSGASTQLVQAESGSIASPMVTANDATASGGQYVYSATADQGSVTVSFDITIADDYYVWCRVLSIDDNTDSFYVSVDGGSELTYGTAPAPSTAWQWTRVNGDNAASGNPRIFTFDQGNHSLAFRTRETMTKLDALYISNDPSFVPSGGGSTTNATPTLNAISNVTINEDASAQTVNLAGISTGGAGETQSLTVTAASSNTGLIPNPTVSYTSPNATGSLSFTPVADASGTATITVTINDGQSQNNTVTRSFTVTVNPANDAPTLNTIANVTANEDAGAQAVSLAGIGSGAANENQTLTVTATSSNTGLIPNPTVSYTSPNATGSLSFTSVANASGTATITVTVNDGQAQNNTFTRTFTVTVNPVNDAPTLNTLANVNINEDAIAQTISLAGISAGSGESQSLTVTAASSNTGVVPDPVVSYSSPNATGSLSFTPAANASGTATITVTVNDGQAQNNTFTRTFTVTVNPVNDAPTLNTIANVTINEDASAQTVSLGGISAGPGESQTLSVTASSSNTGLIPNPSVSYTSPNATGGLTFTPVANAFGSATITVTVNDGQAQNNIATRTFTVTVNSSNDLPTISAIADQSVSESTATAAIPFAVGDLETAAGSLTVSATSANQSVVPNANIALGGSGANRTITVTPAASVSGSALITVQVSDANGGLAVETFTVNVNSVNQAPTLNALANLSLPEDAAQQTVNLGGITTGDVNEDDTLTVTATSSNPGLVPNPTVAYTSPNATGSLAFTPVADASGSATITVTVNDGQANATRTFTVTVTSVNDLPTLGAVTDRTVSEDSGSQSVNLAGIGAGSASENQTLTVSATSSNPALIPNPTVTYISPNTTGTLTFRPATNATGSATITVTVNDGQAQNNLVTRTFTVTVIPVNDLPTITDISNQTINENSSTAALPFVIGDVETPTAGLTLVATSSNPNLIPNSNIVLAGTGANRTVTVTPLATLFGTATITVQVADTDGGTATDTFTLTVNGVNQAPTLASISDLVLNEDAGQQTVSLSGITSGATNELQTLVVSAVSGNTSLIPAPTINYSSPASTGTLTFTPVANASGIATVTVTVNDGQSQSGSFSRTFVVTINAVNDAPTITDLADQSISQNSATALIPFTVGDVETAAGSLTVTASSSNPTLAPVANISLSGSGANRTVKVTPTLNQYGSTIISLTVSDGLGGIASDSFVLNVTAGNLPPTIDPLNDLTIVEDAGTQTMAMTGISSGSVNESQPLSITAVSSNPSLIPNPTLNYSSPSATGSLSFTPAANAHGSATITVVVNDGQSINNAIAETFTVTVNSVNDTPTLNAIANVSVNENSGAQTVALAGITSGAANENQTLTVTAVSSDSSLIPNPTLNYFTPNSTGTLNFTPVAGQNGTATITVTVDDGQSENNTVVRTFTVTVSGANKPPTITDLADLSIPMNSPTVPLALVVGDVETAAASLVLSATSSNPTLVPNNLISFSNTGANRTANVTPAYGQSGVTIITLTVTDTDGGTASDSFVLTVIAPNARPTLDVVADVVMNEDAGTRVVNLTGITDGSTNENQTLILSAISDNPAVVPHPTVTYANPSSSGTLTLSTLTNISGSAYITVTVNDGQAENNVFVRTFRVWVNAENDAPTISAIPNQLVENNTATDTLPFTISDAEYPATWLTVSAASSNPTLIPNANIVLAGTGANRTIKVTPVALLAGSSTISIYVGDGVLSSVSSFLVTVGSTNTPPDVDAPASLATDSYTTLDNVPIVVTDKESRSEDLVLTVTSYNQAVLPGTNITISGSGSNRWLTLKPITGKSGDVTLSLALSDGRALTRANCQLNVQLGTAPKARLNVRKKGRGETQPALDGANLTVGASYTITAVPASDELFTGWSGSVTSSSPSLTFVMASNTVLEVSFTNNPYLSMKGAYNGLFYEVAEVKQKSSGSFTISTSDRGTYTGKLKLGNSTYPLSGRIDLLCKATNTIVRKGYSTLSVELDFAGGATNQVVGRVTDTVWEAPLLGDRSSYNSKVNPAPFAGTYTLIVPGQDDPELGPEGDGFASIKVDGNGLATLTGTLADGTKVSLKTPLSESGQLPLYVPLYTGGGSVLSWLAITNQVADDIHGLLSWLKPTQSSAKIYGSGFTNETFVTGSRYTPPISSTNRVLNLAEADVFFGGGNLESEWANSILWSLQNKITNLGDNKLVMTVATATGLINGTVTDPNTGKSIKFSGAVHQKQNFGSGFLLGTNRSARMVVRD